MRALGPRDDSLRESSPRPGDDADQACVLDGADSPPDLVAVDGAAGIASDGAHHLQERPSGIPGGREWNVVPLVTIELAAHPRLPRPHDLYIAIVIPPTVLATLGEVRPQPV
jgi:hypothetical protein